MPLVTLVMIKIIRLRPQLMFRIQRTPILPTSTEIYDQVVSTHKLTVPTQKNMKNITLTKPMTVITTQ